MKNLTFILVLALSVLQASYAEHSLTLAPEPSAPAPANRVYESYDEHHDDDDDAVLESENSYALHAPLEPENSSDDATQNVDRSMADTGSQYTGFVLDEVKNKITDIINMATDPNADAHLVQSISTILRGDKAGMMDLINLLKASATKGSTISQLMDTVTPMIEQSQWYLVKQAVAENNPQLAQLLMPVLDKLAQNEIPMKDLLEAYNSGGLLGAMSLVVPQDYTNTLLSAKNKLEEWRRCHPSSRTAESLN